MSAVRPPAAAESAAGAQAPAWWSAAVGAAAFLAYLGLAPAVPGDKDAAEFVLVLAVNGAAHPTGYPLYTLLGHGFVAAAHALGAGWTLAANAWSALGAGVAIALMHALGARWIAPDPAAPGAPRLSPRALALAALVPPALFAFNPAWTAEATLAEVHSWHLAWVMGASLGFVTLARAISGAGEWSTRGLLARAAAWGLVCGIGGAHHTSSVLVVAPLSLALLIGLARAGRLGPAPVAAALAGALVPLASYGLLFAAARHPGPAVWANLEPTWRSVLEHVTGAQYRAFIGRFSPSQIQRRMLALYIYPFLFPWLPVLVAAARARGFTERLIGSALCGTVGLQILSTFGYGVPDPAPYFLPPVALALCATAPVGARLLTGGARRGRLVAAAFGALGVAALALAGPWISRAALRRTLLVELERRIRATWSAIPFERGFVLWGDDMYHRLHGYQVLGREKLELMVLNPLALSGPAPRRRFYDRFGFDPYDGVVVSPDLVLHPTSSGPLDQFVTDVGRRIKAGTGLPVAVFDWRRGAAVPIEEPASP